MLLPEEAAIVVTFEWREKSVAFLCAMYLPAMKNGVPKTMNCCLLMLCTIIIFYLFIVILHLTITDWNSALTDNTVGIVGFCLSVSF